jgi:hypothetical protein
MAIHDGTTMRSGWTAKKNAKVKKKRVTSWN